eukprot:TRINITY_DN6498_c0_g1_i1.p1 TRINITY_DN6498_c0_g1~~TRINITY_DN6498_c0_g1_i1.p1  ORF type:complete len:1581 (-),score=487.74 TRINITY_DN6498_c0_g1_i1:38-4732(-)
MELDNKFDVEVELFHQKEELTTRISNILEDYPTGIGPFKEFLQNADDARAKKFAVVLDLVDYKKDRKESLFTEALHELQGPALLLYNDSTFSNEDFLNITSLGKSQKYDDNSRIGKYGLGFNVSYHFTDVVSIVSRDQLVLFDPHAKFLPNNMPGMRLNFLNGSLKERYPNQLEPFVQPLLGNDMTAPLRGTIIRLPLRSKDQATSSLLSKASYTGEEVYQTLRELCDVIPSLLLFLKSVEEISIHCRRSRTEVELLGRAQIRNSSEQLRKERSLVNSFTRENRVSSTYQLELSCVAGTQQNNLTWLVHNGSCVGGEALEDKTHQFQWAGVAAILSGDSDEAWTSSRAYCFLPLPIDTGLPININALFALNSNRRSLWSGEGADLKAEWNDFILSNTLPLIYGQFLEKLLHTLSGLEENGAHKFYAMWPDISRAVSPFDRVVIGLAKDASEHQRKFFWTGTEWCSLSEVVFETERTRLHCRPSLRKLLASVGVKLCDPPHHVRSSLKKADVSWTNASPEQVSRAIRDSNAALTIEEAEDLVEFILGGDQHLVSPHTLDLLIDIPCVPLVGGGIAKLRKATTDKEKNLYVTAEKFVALMPKFPALVDPNSPSFSKFEYWAKHASVINILPLTPKVVSDNFSYVLPFSWRGNNVVRYREDNIGGNTRDKELDGNNGTVPVVDLAELDDQDWQPASKSKKGKKKVAVSVGMVATSRRRDSSPQQISAFVGEENIDVSDALQRLRLLWELVEANHDWKKGDHRLFVAWPTVVTEEGYVFSVEYAVRRVTLRSGDFSAQQKAIFRKFGCVFARDATDDVAKLSQAIGTLKKDIGRALSVGYDHPEKIDRKEIELLRRQLLEWFDSGEGIDSAGIRSLPVFRTFGDQFLAISQEGPLATPHDEDPYASSSAWDALLRSEYPNELLDMRHDDDIKLLKLAQVPRSPMQKFIVNFLFKHLEDLPQAACVAMLSVVGDVKIGGNKSLIDPLKKARVVVLADRTRHLCSDFVDPTDVGLCEILKVQEAQELLPPTSYRKKEVLKVMQKCGMLTLRTASGFMMAAKKAAELQNIHYGNILVDSFCNIHRESSFSWHPADYAQIAEIPFVPAFDLRDSFLPGGSVDMPNFETFEKNPVNKNSNIQKPTTKKHRQNFFKLIEEDEAIQRDLERAKQADDPAFSVLDGFEIFDTASTMIQSGKQPMKHPPVLFCKTKLCSLQSTAWFTWKMRPILPSKFDSLSVQILKNLQIAHPPPTKLVAKNLSVLVAELSAATSQTLVMDNLQILQGVILLSCAAINQQLRGDLKLLPVIQNALCNLPFVICDDGALVLPSQIVFELTEDLSYESRAPPSYLLPLENFLKSIGSPSVRSANMPKVISNAHNAPLDLGLLIEGACNDPALCDVVFVTADGRELYAHKLVLGLTCETFKVMFASGMAESQLQKLRIPLPEWTDYDSFLLLLRYLYSGIIEGTDEIRLHPPSQMSSSVVCCLLRLADQYLLDYLKQWCEVYLSDQSMLHLQNICTLFQLADECNAKQLFAVCRYHMQAMPGVVTQMDEWKALPPILQQKILRTLPSEL